MRTRSNNPYLLGLLGLGLTSLASLSLAAESPATGQAPANKLDTLTVVGTRTETSIKDIPASVSVLERDDIEKRGADSVAELLRDLPGISLVDSAVAGMKRIRKT